MKATKDFFLAGYKATWSGSYFNAVELLSHYVDFPHPELLKKVNVEMKTLKADTQTAVADLLSVQNFANELSVHIMPPPEFPEAYFSWARMCYSGFEDKLKDVSPEKVAFDIGYFSGEILTSMKMLGVILRISLAVVGVPAFEPQWKNCAKTILRAQKKLNAAARLSTMIPSGPIILHDEWYAQLGLAAHEIGEAEVNFVSEAYLRLLSGKIDNYLLEFSTKAQELTKKL